jgi:hypothetical protein
MSTITSTARVSTTRAPRYGKQLVSHLGRRSVGVWDEDGATGTLDMTSDTPEKSAHVAFSSTPEALLIELTTADTDAATYEDVIGRHLVRFGERDELRVQWVRSNGETGTAQD